MQQAVQPQSEPAADTRFRAPPCPRGHSIWRYRCLQPFAHSIWVHVHFTLFTSLLVLTYISSHSFKGEKRCSSLSLLWTLDIWKERSAHDICSIIAIHFQQNFHIWVLFLSNSSVAIIVSATKRKIAPCCQILSMKNLNATSTTIFNYLKIHYQPIQNYQLITWMLHQQ